MTMQKVQILKDNSGSWQTVVDCSAQFNPNKLKLSKSAKWKTDTTWKSNVGTTTFEGGKPIDLSVTLFFDTTRTSTDVRAYTGPLMDLTLVDVEAASKISSADPADIQAQIDEQREAFEANQKNLNSINKEWDKKIQDQEEHLATLKAQLQTVREEIKQRLAEYGLDADTDYSNPFFYPQFSDLARQESGLETQIEMSENLITSYESQKNLATLPLTSMTTALQNQISDLEKQLGVFTAGGAAAPPKCKFVWGDFSFVCLVKSVNVTYIMFLPDGTPIRANADVKLQQIEEQSMYPAQNPTSRSAARKVWVVQEGQTLDWIAYKEYGDPALWRHLAQRNDIKNPQDIYPGQILVV